MSKAHGPVSERFMRHHYGAAHPAPSLTLPAGSVVHFRGMPFALAGDTLVVGSAANLALAASNDAERPKTQQPTE